MSQEIKEILKKIKRPESNELVPAWWVRENILCFVDEALAKFTEQPPAGDFTKRFRDLIKLSIEHLSDNKIGRLQTYSKEACDRLDRSEASREELLSACDEGLHECERAKMHCTCKHKNIASLLLRIERIEAAIAKEKEVRE